MARFDALVVDPVPESRAAIKEILHNEQKFGENIYKGVYFASNTLEALARLIENNGADVLFISDRIQFDEIQQFIQTAKDLEGDRASTYIVVLESSDHDTLSMSQSLSYGADGFLRPPVSVEALREITEIAQRIKREAEDRLIKVAMRMLVETLVDEIETRADKLRSADLRMGFGRQLKTAVRRLLGDDEKAFELYFEILQNTLTKMPPHKYISYAGSSERVRRRWEEALGIK